MRRANFQLAIHRHQRAGRGDHVTTTERPGEAEMGVAGGDQARHPRQARGRARHRAGQQSVQHQHPVRHGFGQRHRLPLPMAAGLQQHAVPSQLPDMVDQSPPRLVARVGHHQRRRPEPQRHPFRGLRADQQQRVRRPQHRMQVEHHIGAFQQRPQHPGAAQFGRPAGALQQLPVPDTVEILFEEPAGGWVFGREARIGVKICEDQRQPAGNWPQPRAQPTVQQDGTADLVAMIERHHGHVRPGRRRVEAPGATHDVAIHPWPKVGRGDAHRQAGAGVPGG